MSILGQRPQRPTIEDVAAAAGVSVATVSRALRGLPNVAIATRERVTEVATQLDYTANPAASRLAAGRTQTVSVIVPNLGGWYSSTIVAGIEAVCAEAGYDVMVVGVGSRNDVTRLLSEGYQLERRTDGIVVIDVPVASAEAASISARGVGLATVGTTTPGHASIRVDNSRVGRMAADHLAGLGHERLGLIGGTMNDSIEFPAPVFRYCGFVEALADRGIDFDPALFEIGHFELEGGQEAMATLLDQPVPPTGVFAMSDEMAFGALMELDRRGIVAGTDVSVMGVDDHTFAQVVNLTTIRQPIVDHGAAAARMLLESMRPAGPADEHQAAPEIVVPVELIVRSTTATRR